MKCNEIQLMIQEFHDGVLESEKEGFIFTHMGSCPECRSFLKGLGMLSHSASLENKIMPRDLDLKIMKAVEEKRNQTETDPAGSRKRSEKGSRPETGHYLLKSPVTYISAVMTAAVVMLLIFLMRTKVEYDQVLKETMNTVQQQNRQIEMILNSYPEVQVSPRHAKEIVINAKL